MPNVLYKSETLSKPLGKQASVIKHTTYVYVEYFLTRLKLL